MSVTIDPARDGPAELEAYRRRFTVDEAGWILARLAGTDNLRDWLEAFGVVVIPDGLGGYVHNAAVHMVGPDRRLVAILDFQDTERIAETARELIGRELRHVAAR